MQPGDLREVIDLQKWTTQFDEYGNEIGGGFETAFSAPAAIRTLKASETVIAGRLAGTQTVVCTIRYQPAVADMDTAWQAINSRDGTVYAFKAITPDARKAWVEILAQTGASA